MRCDEAREAFSDLYDGALTGAPLANLDRHLEGCSACRAEWSAFRKAMQAVADLGTAEPSPGFATRVMDRVEAPSLGRRLVEALFLPLYVKVPLQGVALVLVAFTAVMVFQRSPELKREAEVRDVPEGRPRGAAPAAPPSGRSISRDTKGPDVAKAQAPPIVPPAQSGAAAPKTEGARQADRLPALPSLAPPARTDAEKDRPGGMPGRAGTSPPPETPAPHAPAPPPPPLSALGRPAAPAPVMRAPVPPAAVHEETNAAGKAAAPARAEDTAGKTKAEEGESEPRDEFKQGHIASAPARAADALYSAALTAYARQGYDRAIENFRAFLVQHPQDGRVPDARFWLADSYFLQQRYAEAIAEYEALIRQFPESRRVPAALLKQGEARLALGDSSGCQALRDVAARYPRAREGSQAREGLAARCP